MKQKRLLRFAAAGLLAAMLLSASALAADSADVVSIALGEMGYTEEPHEHTKFGEWYGYPNGYWCDMFVSWCAMTAGVPKAQFPRHCGCTEHVKLFSQMGRYQYSAARGGSYVPQQGDVIFFYNYLSHPKGSVSNHTGLVLYVENGYVYTIEGNALANRLDYSYGEVSALLDDSLDPPDRVVVNCYPLDAPQIHGYGIPDYDTRTPLALEGFVDLGTYHSEDAEVYQYLSDTGVMAPTSSHTFSPDHGMTRGEFMMMVVDFFGIPEYAPLTVLFDDVAMEDDCYIAVMSARSMGLINGTEDNRFLPDLYISSDDARMILERALMQLGIWEDFSFSEGARSYLLTPYTTRADIAQAFCKLCKLMPVPEAFEGQIILENTVCYATTVDGAYYVPLDSLQLAVPGVEKIERVWSASPNWKPERILPGAVELRYEGRSLIVNGFLYRDVQYVDLNAAAEFLALEPQPAILPEGVDSNAAPVLQFLHGFVA